MSKYIWLNNKRKMPTAIILDKISSLQIRYEPFTDSCHTSFDKYILVIHTVSEIFTEEYSTQREAKNRMDKILSLIKEE